MSSLGAQPPTPSLSRFTQTRRFVSEPLSLLTECLGQCGEIFTLNLLGLGPWVFLCSPEGARSLFKAPRDVLGAGEIHHRMLGGLFGPNTLFTLDGEAHHQRQRLVFPPLSGASIESCVTLAAKVAERTSEQWRPGPFAMLSHAHHMSLEILIRILFGEKDTEQVRRLSSQFFAFSQRGVRSALIRMPWLQLNLGPLSPWGRVLKLRDETRECFRQALRNSAESTPLLEALREAQDEKGQPLSEDDKVDELLTLLFAGHETTGGVLTWVLECVLSRPRVHEKVAEEINRVIGQGRIEATHLRQLNYLEAVIFESMRIRPLGPFSAFREVLKPFEILGYELPPGWVVAHSFPVMSLRPELFPEPYEFKPERFLGAPQKPYTWNPFGGGTRVCAGRGAAMVELKVVLATLLNRTRLRLLDSDVKPVRSGQFMTPEGGLRVELAA